MEVRGAGAVAAVEEEAEEVEAGEGLGTEEVAVVEVVDREVEVVVEVVAEEAEEECKL